jgi:hypothetical protein
MCGSPARPRRNSSSEQSWAQSFDRRPASRSVVAGSHMDECAVAGNPVSEPNGHRGCAFQPVEGLQVQMRFSAVAGIAAPSDLVTGPDPVPELHLRASSLQVTECDDGRSAVDHDVVAGECPPPGLDPLALRQRIPVRGQAPVGQSGRVRNRGLPRRCRRQGRSRDGRSPRTFPEAQAAAAIRCSSTPIAAIRRPARSRWHTRSRTVPSRGSEPDRRGCSAPATVP